MGRTAPAILFGAVLILLAHQLNSFERLLESSLFSGSDNAHQSSSRSNAPNVSAPESELGRTKNSAIALTNITGGNVPPHLAEVRSDFLAMMKDPTAAAVGSLDAAYFHMLQIRAGAQFHRFGSTGRFHSQWQTSYWKAREQFVRGKVKTVCEAGLGSGHSGIALLTATTNTSWYDDGAMFHSFDNGLKNEPHKKVAAYDYTTNTFGGRVKFHFGPQSSVEVDKVRENDPDFTCDIVHIDADHSAPGVMKDLDAMHRVSHESTVLLMDDYNSGSIKDALEGRKNITAIDTVYTQDGMVDWLIQSAEDRRPGGKKKVYIVGHFKY